MNTFFFVKVSNIKFYENASGGSEFDTCGQTDGREKVNSCFSRLLLTRLKGECYVLVTLSSHACVLN
jgi:hypothetical protein